MPLHSTSFFKKTILLQSTIETFRNQLWKCIVKYRKASKIMCKLFHEPNVSYNLHQDVSFHSCNVKTVLYGTETLSYLGPLLLRARFFGRAILLAHLIGHPKQKGCAKIKLMCSSDRETTRNIHLFSLLPK